MTSSATCSLRLALLATLVLYPIAGCGGDAPAAPPKADPSSRRALGSGDVTGFVGRYQSHVWLGLRFAQAPKGRLRFRAPVPLAPSGSRQALTLGAPCPQIASPYGVTTAEPGSFVGDEDCLFLNVYAPRMSAEQAASSRLPVMVWIHGGGNTVGHAGGYDGGNLAQRERVVVVAVNYRLGPLGWMRHASLREGASADDASGNYGTLDLIAGLEWVQKHAAAFGGDPANVTIFGESAGARNVITLLAAPRARGLFHRAIAQSGNVRVQDAHKSEAFESDGGYRNSSNEVLLRLSMTGKADGRAAEERERLGALTPAEGAVYWRKVSPQALIAAYGDPERPGSLGDVPNVFGDGAVLPTEPLLSVFARDGAYSRVPTMLGTNRDESKTFMLADPRFVKSLTPLYLRLRDPERYKATAQAMSRAWRVAGADAPASALAGSGAQVFVYRFDWDEEPTLLGAELSVMLGAGHGFEIPFVFGHWELSPRANRMFTDANRPGRDQLSKQMMGYWAEFARSGRPGTGGGAAGPEWQPFGASPGTQRFLIFDTERDGGVRMQAGTIDMRTVLATVEKDTRLRNAQERCTVMGDVVRSSPLLDPAIYPTLGGGACRAFPLRR